MPDEPVSLPVLVPAVKHLEFRPAGTCRLDALTTVTMVGMARGVECRLLEEALARHERSTQASGTVAADIRLACHGSFGDEGYSIDLSEKTAVVTAASPRGLFYGVQTLLQLLNHYHGTIPSLYIRDEPDFTVRGYYHDVTRGKVPKLDTLKYLVDKIASYKINQLQLYVEHAFAFSAVPEFGERFDTLTKEEITQLDLYCRERHIDLVPSLATFGHLYELLRIPRLAHLNELPVDASQQPRNLWDRMAHYTIDPCNKESFALVKSMLEEYCSLFTSSYVNICCDETFDLGKGKNAGTAMEKGVGRLYVEFVKKILAVVTGMGKRPMMWGDIVIDHPDLLYELPANTIFLNWNYKPDCTAEATQKFAHAGVTQYVCPGVIGWSRFANDIMSATKNIRRKIAFGKASHAAGVLTTDWGDCGHVNFLSASLHGMVLGAALSWNAASFPDDTAFDKAAATLEWGPDNALMYDDLREVGSLCDYHFGNIYAWITATRCLWYREDEISSWKYDGVRERFTRADSIMQKLMHKLNAAEQTIAGQEILCGVREIRWTLALLCAKIVHEFGCAGKLPMSVEALCEETEKISADHSRLWLVRNKRSELENITAVFAQVNDRLKQWQ